jgi:hypothetical protein
VTTYPSNPKKEVRCPPAKLHGARWQMPEGSNINFIFTYPIYPEALVSQSGSDISAIRQTRGKLAVYLFERKYYFSFSKLLVRLLLS